MQLVLSEADFIKLKPATREDLLANLFPQSNVLLDSNTHNLEWEDVANLTPSQVDEFMKGCHEQTIAGLRVIAEHGPEIHASLLNQAGIDNYGHFQGRVTKRTRTITKNKHAYLFTWDNWHSEVNKGVGHYAVSDATFRSLRAYFSIN